MPLLAGDWNMNANGHQGILHVDAIDAQGNLDGSMFDDAMEGFWDETSKKITFLRKITPGDKSTFQIYTGYLFINELGPQVIHTLAGYFEAFQGGGGTPQTPVYGWFAQQETVNL